MSAEPSVLSLRFDFLDQQIVDADGLPLGRVEDVELAQARGEPPHVAAVLTGAEALGERMGGGLGEALARTARRLREPASDEGPTRIEIEHVESAGPKLELKVRHDEIPHVAALERWLSERVVGRIPGAGG
jgi:sporulation protein YlmC with PRC-barrel domain